jgi:dipeptidyl aminopeptidase/acylaminoacyl peptidase
VNKRFNWFLLSFFLFALGMGNSAAGEPSRPKRSLDPVLDALSASRQFKEVALSPDGQRVAWVETLKGAEGTPSAVYVADLREPSAKPRRITAGDSTSAHAERGIAWSADGSQLAFLSDKEKKGQLQLYVAAVAGGKPRKLTQLAGLLAHPHWSPDGKRLAFLFTENASRAAGPTTPGAAEVGLVGEQVEEQRLSVLDLDSGRTRLVSPADLYVYEYDWSPDSKQLAAIAAHGAGDNNWYIAQLYRVTLATGETQSLLKPTMQIAAPRWSPDGKTIAFIGGLMSDEGMNGGDIYVIPATGGRPRNLTPDLKASASWLTWSPSGEQLLFAEHVEGSSGLARLEVSNGRITTLWTGAEVISTGDEFTPSISLSRDHKVSAAIRHSFHRPPEVWAGPIGEWKQWTHANDDFHPPWGEVKSLHWKSEDWQVQGWLLYPCHYDSKRSYPLIVSVHGGPASVWKPRWPRAFDLTWLSSQDYFVFYPNPRGSMGQGEKFTRANVKDFGHGDLRDILSGVDEILKTVPVDKDRLGIAGWSYGGFQTMWAVTQTHRFRAAIAGAGIANWQSYYGQNDIDQWLIPYFGASVYDDPAVYARSSPINFIKRVKTPTLLLVGERDIECPPMQSREFWHALKTRGVPTQMMVYPGEGHGIVQPKHRRDIARRTLAWFDKYLQ